MIKDVKIKKATYYRRYTMATDKLVKLTKHHRRCRSRGGSNADTNISIVPEELHRAYHRLFMNATAGELAKILNDTWIDPEVKLIVVKRSKR